MSNDDIGIEHIEREIADAGALGRLADRLERLAETHRTRIEAHAEARSVRRSARAGSLLASSRLSPASRSRYAAMLFFERQLEGAEVVEELDRSMLVLSGCQILEDQLRNQLLPVAREGSAQLLQAIAGERSEEVLRAWLDDKVPATIGVLHVILMALRRALVREPAGARVLLHGPFTAAFDQPLAAKGLEKSIGEIRNSYRNPLAHGTSLVDLRGYSTFCALLLGAPSASAWDSRGPSLDPPAPHVALLHHHLSSMTSES